MSTGDATSMFTSPANGTGRPAIVIFTAILNLLTAFFAYLAAALIFVLGLLSAVLGLQQYAVAHADKMIPMINWPLGVSLLIGLAVTAIASYATLYLFLGLGLLRGKAPAWYLQIAMSVLGLFVVPFGTVINAAILVMFFQAPVREHFKV